MPETTAPETAQAETDEINEGVCYWAVRKYREARRDHGATSQEASVARANLYDLEELIRNLAASRDAEPALATPTGAGTETREAAVEAASAAYYDGMTGWPHEMGWAVKSEPFREKVRAHMRRALDAATLAAAPAAPPANGGTEDKIEAAQITLGEGLVDITRIEHEGRVGVLFRPRAEHIPFGNDGELQEGKYWPVSGDVVLWVSGEGPQVAIDALATLAPATPAPAVDGGTERLNIARSNLAVAIGRIGTAPSEERQEKLHDAFCLYTEAVTAALATRTPAGAAGDPVGCKLRDHDPKALRGFAHLAWREGDKDTHRVLTASAARIEALEAVVQPPRQHQPYWTGACFGMTGASFNLSFPAGTGEFVFREDEIEQIDEEGRTLWVSKIDASELIELRQWLNDYLPTATEATRPATQAPTPSPESTLYPAQVVPSDGGGNWRDDPSADDRWNSGLDFGMVQLCAVLGVDPNSVSWDAATETLDGDVRSVIGNILTAWAGDDWQDLTPNPSPESTLSPAQVAIEGGGAQEAAEEAAYQLGREEGAADGIQRVAERIGIDSEYRWSSNPERSQPGAVELLDRIVEHVATLASTPASAGEGDLREAVSKLLTTWTITDDDVPNDLNAALQEFDKAVWPALAALARPAAPAVDVPAERERIVEILRRGSAGLYHGQGGIDAVADAILATRPTDPGGARGEKDYSKDFQLMLVRIIQRHRNGRDLTETLNGAEDLLKRKGSLSVFRAPAASTASSDAGGDA